MVAVGYHKRAGTAQQKGRRRNAETPMRLSDALLVHTPFEGGRGIPAKQAECIANGSRRTALLKSSPPPCR
jgi:hypothetical protein